MNLGAATLPIGTCQQPLPEGIRKVTLLPSQTITLHQPIHKLMGHQLKAVDQRWMHRKREAAETGFKGCCPSTPAELVGMAASPPNRTLTLKGLGLQDCQGLPQIALTTEPPAIRRVQRQQGSLNHAINLLNEAMNQGCPN